MKWHPEMRQLQFSIDEDSEDEEEGLWASHVRAKQRKQGGSAPPGSPQASNPWDVVERWKAARGSSLLPGMQSAGRMLGKMSSKIYAKVGSIGKEIGKAAASKVARVSEPLASKLLTSDTAAAVVSSAQKAVQSSAAAASKVVDGSASAASAAVESLSVAAAAVGTSVGAAAAGVVSAPQQVSEQLKKAGGQLLAGKLQRPSSKWMVVDITRPDPGQAVQDQEPAHGASPSGNAAPLCCIALHAAPHMERLVREAAQRPTAATLVALESHKNGPQVFSSHLALD